MLGFLEAQEMNVYRYFAFKLTFARGIPASFNLLFPNLIE
jgi:hypothetical protein